MNKNRYFIKVCGLTRQSDVSAAMGMGAHFCGFIFHPASPRYISPSRVAALRSGLLRRVGVFVRQSAPEILEIMKTARLDFAQLHGPQSLDCARHIGPERVIRVLWPDRYDSPDDLHKEMDLWADSCAWFLLDAGRQGGGHGTPLNWASLATLAPPRPWFLAGGLSSSSLTRALEQCAPDGVDLNSGVEAIPGQKDPQKLLATLRSLTPQTLCTTYHIS